MARSPASKDLPVLAVIVIAMIGLCLGTYFLHGYRFPIGPDAPCLHLVARLAGFRSPLGGRGAQLLAGLLTGLFALHLAAGNVTNLSLATMFWRRWCSWVAYPKRVLDRRVSA